MTRFRKLQIAAAGCLLVVMVAALIWRCWWVWSSGTIMASANANSGRFIIREVPDHTDLLTMFLGTNGFAYRMEYWRPPDTLTDSVFYYASSYKADLAHIEVSPKLSVFYLHDDPVFIFTDHGGWKEAQAGPDLALLNAALRLYRHSTGSYPSTQQGLGALVNRPTKSPVRKRRPNSVSEATGLDPWGRSYVYRFPGATAPDRYDLFSRGPDGVESADDIVR